MTDRESLKDARYERLPKWAQQEIVRLERDLAYAKARLADDPGNSRVFADPYSDPPRPLGYDTAIDFRFGEAWSERITVRIDRGGLKLHGGSTLLITPDASNVIHVETSP